MCVCVQCCDIYIDGIRPSSLPLQLPQQFEAESGIKSQETRTYIFNSLSDIAQVGNQGNSLEEHLDCAQFVALLALMLTVDPVARVSPSQALESQFITMQHLSMHTNTHR